MKKQLLLIPLFLGILLIGCNKPSTQLTESQKSEIEKEILSLLDSINIPLKTLDVDGFSKFISSENFIANFWKDTLVTTSDGFINLAKSRWSDAQSQDFKQNYLKITVLTPALVIVDREGIVSYKDQNGQTHEIKDFLSSICRKEQSGWKIIHTHETQNY